MLDRFGYRIQVGWAPHEILWLEVACTDGADGIHQVADLTGRTYTACYSKAWSLGYRGKRHELYTASRPTDAPPKPPKPKRQKRKIPAPIPPKHKVMWAKPVPKPIPRQSSFIRPLSKAELMGGSRRRRVCAEVVSV